MVIMITNDVISLDKQRAFYRKQRACGWILHLNNAVVRD